MDLPTFLRSAANMLRRAPVSILLGEIRDLETLDAAILAALSGHGLYGTLHVETVHEAITRMISLYPIDAQSGAAHKLLGALRVIVVQRLLPTLDGKRIALRSWFEFSKPVKEQLSSIAVEKWPQFIRDQVSELHQDFRHFAREACLAGKISFSVYADEAALSPEERMAEQAELEPITPPRGGI